LPVTEKHDQEWPFWIASDTSSVFISLQMLKAGNTVRKTKIQICLLTSRGSPFEAK
jgi:hypothetical protein